MTVGASAIDDKTSAKGREVGEAESEAVCSISAPADPALAAIVTAWPMLPADVRAGIVAIVNAAAKS
jgi:hypothetical protein